MWRAQGKWWVLFRPNLSKDTLCPCIKRGPTLFLALDCRAGRQPNAPHTSKSFSPQSYILYCWVLLHCLLSQSPLSLSLYSSPSAGILQSCDIASSSACKTPSFFFFSSPPCLTAVFVQLSEQISKLSGKYAKVPFFPTSLFVSSLHLAFSCMHRQCSVSEEILFVCLVLTVWSVRIAMRDAQQQDQQLGICCYTDDAQIYFSVKSCNPHD